MTESEFNGQAYALHIERLHYEVDEAAAKARTARAEAECAELQLEHTRITFQQLHPKATGAVS